jgi:hypothetical protein
MEIQMSLTEQQPPVAAFTVGEFCDAHRIGRTALYAFWNRGRGPRYFWNGARRLISAEAAAEWRHQMETEAAQSPAA